jgi:hypothetical protein
MLANQILTAQQHEVDQLPSTRAYTLQGYSMSAKG